MAIQFKTPTQVSQQYLLELKGLKPELNTDQEDNDWFIRSRVIGGVAAGIYADQRLLSNDAFPQRARRDAILRYLELYFQEGFEPATAANGVVGITGDPGSTITQGTEFLYEPNGNTYQATETIVLVGTTGQVEATSVATGQAQNLLAGAALTLPSAPNGIEGTAVVLESFSDAREEETIEQARARILARIREPLSVGRVSDYEQYALEASSSVVNSSVRRYPFGFGTVAVYITSGTTDIDAAVDNGDVINIIPSQNLIDTVQAYLDINRPVTDCVTVLPPTALPVDVDVRVRFAQGDASTILSGQTLTQGELVQREVKRALYKMPVGGRVFGASGYVVASEIEETIDVGLSAEPVSQGVLQILVDRQVLDLSLTGHNRLILPNEAPTPGTINILTF